VEEEIKKRIAAGNKTYYVYKAMFGSRALSRSSELRLYNSVVRPVVIYAHETWVLKKEIENKLLTFERKILRRIFGPTTQPDGTRSRKTNEELNSLINTKI
jgi:hypothetical protein